MVDVGKRNELADLEDAVATEVEVRRKKRVKVDKTDRTRIARDVRKGIRKPPPVPRARSLAEIHDMDPQSKLLRHPDGRPRKHFVAEDSVEIRDDLPFRDTVRADRQRRANERRGRARKGEAEVVKAREVLERPSNARENKLDIYDEERAIAEGILSLDDWDNQELIRGYRRSRDGKFGKPPKYIPREVQHEAFRRLVHRGNRKFREAYMQTVEDLIELAHTSSSDKVKLEAQKELLNRIVGKVPDIVVGAQMEQPWENILADSIVPLSDEPIDMQLDDSGVAQMIPYPEDVPSDVSADDGAPRGGTSSVAPSEGTTTEAPRLKKSVTAPIKRTVKTRTKSSPTKPRRQSTGGE